ncbi:MAG: hypothetical protein ABI337_08260 [Nitrososphaera sp.]
MFQLTNRQKTILDLIPKDGRVSTSNLQKMSQIGMNVLSKELKVLEKRNLVKRIVDTSRRPPGTFYSHNKTRFHFELDEKFIKSHFLWIQRKQNHDGSWNEINHDLKDRLSIIKQKIVYTNQILRLFDVAGKHNLKAAKTASNFIEHAPTIQTTEYDYSLRFYPYYYFNNKYQAKKAVEEIAQSQRKSGISESRRYLQFWFALLYTTEILYVYDKETFRKEIDRATNVILRNLDESNWDDNPSITSWALRILKYTNKLNRLPDTDGSKSIEWLDNKLNGSKWDLDFEPPKDTITPEIACDFTTTSHVLINLIELTDIMNDDQIENCIKRPFQWLKRQSSGNYFNGRTKPDPYVTSLALRALIKVTKFVN